MTTSNEMNSDYDSACVLLTIEVTTAEFWANSFSP